ncbi:MAG: hypothetical protein Q8L37_07220 [Candidatus Gottesmanbacteria bacterium]|nr:hypothetical protein [Candidatus Gottesmanbacteria bacterium]
MSEIKVNTFYPTKPHSGQKEVLKALDDGFRFIQLRAGRKWRKTSLLISWLFEMALKTNLTCPYVSPNRVQSKNIVWSDHVQRMLDHFTGIKLPYKKNEAELSISLPNGGKVQLLGVENAEALRGISNWGAFAGDEIDDWESNIWPTVIRPNLITNKAPAIMAGTPKGFRQLYSLEQSGLFKCFHFTSSDNPELDPQELQALITEYKQMGMGYYRQEILAEYEKPHGVVYEDWDMETRYIPFDYDPLLPLHLAWDFGVNDPTVILFLQQRGSEIRLIDYIEDSNANIDHFVQAVSAKPYIIPSFEAGDIAGTARDLTTGKSPIEELARLGHYVKTSFIPDIPTQIRNAHRFMSRLYVSSSNPNCSRFRDCLVNYCYPQKRETMVNQSNEIPIHNQYSHAMRAFEYYCWNLDQTPKTNSYQSLQKAKELKKKWRIG